VPCSGRARSRLPRAALAVVAAWLALSPVAEAEPSLWQRAKSPSAVGEARLLAAIERLLDARDQAGGDDELAQRFARAAVALIDLAKPGQPADPRLACAMAQALLGADVGRTKEAEALLQQAVTELPPGELLARAWHELGIARSLRSDHAGARDADSHVLELAWEAGLRATSLYNRAEAEGRLGQLAAAVRDYRQATELAPGLETQALAGFGLGVALERQGDLPSAYAALDRALTIRLPLSLYPSDDPLDLPGVFFVPAYERYYLTALIAMARARHAEDQDSRRAEYEQAVLGWDAYLAAAEPTDPWLANARRHQARASAELKKLPGRHRHAR
jgi:tetratricopeptide (TPR) repeat protein